MLPKKCLNEMSNNKISERFSCDLCKKSFVAKEVIKKHLENIHLNVVSDQDPDGEYCGFCKKFIFKNSFKDHVKQKHNRIECKVCDKVYFNKSTFHNHKRTHEVEYTCDHCNSKFSLKRTLEEHILRVHLRKTPRSKCEHCGKYLVSTNLKRHIRAVHEKQLDFVCDACNKGFQNKQMLRDHLAVVHLNQQNHLCTICNKNFAHSFALVRHLNTVHGAQPRIKCEKCVKTFTRRGDYKSHLKLHKTRPFHCQSFPCKFMSQTKEALEKHELVTHIKPKWYRQVKHTCSKCDKTYKSSLGLKRHVDKEHLGLMFQCDLCGKKLTRKDHIRDHLLKQHLGGK